MFVFLKYSDRLNSFNISFQEANCCRCTGIWPRSAAHWPLMHLPWPGANLVADIKTEGFDLLSRESAYARADKQQRNLGEYMMNNPVKP